MLRHLSAVTTAHITDMISSMKIRTAVCLQLAPAIHSLQMHDRGDFAAGVRAPAGLHPDGSALMEMTSFSNAEQGLRDLHEGLT